MSDFSGKKCPNGHPHIPENRYIRGRRNECRLCAQEVQRRRAATAREERLLKREAIVKDWPCPPGARLIPLSQKSGIGLAAIVDEADYEVMKHDIWFLIGPYAARCRKNSEKPGTHFITMHRLIMNPPAGTFVDHKNRIPLDNRRSNLRYCTRAQNQMNQISSKITKTGYRGVSLTRSGKPYKAEIRAEGKHYYIGVYDDAWEAAQAYNEAAIRLHGEFACLNVKHDE